MNKRQNKGFTIVELLIVVVVIAILAAITIVAYNGITNQSRRASMQNNLQQTAKLIESYKIETGSYPIGLGVLNKGAGVRSNNDSRYAYTLDGVNYLLSIGSANSNDTYKVSSAQPAISSGSWPGHDTILGGYATRAGFTNLTMSYGTGDNMAIPVDAVPVGSWMIYVMSYFVNEDPVAPDGWTVLQLRKTTNTMQTSIFAKIKQPGDPATYEIAAPGSSGINFVNATLLWGANSAPISSWQVGTSGDRAANATSTTAVTPTMNVTNARSLVLSIATERTNADETSYTSLTGAIPWIFIPQPTGDVGKNQTISIGYNQQQNPGTSQPMTVTYPNAQTYNATAIQIAIPPAS